MQISELHGRGFASWKIQVSHSLGRGTLESSWMFSHFELSSLKQKWMGYELVGLIRAAACLENSPFGTWTCSFIYLSSMAAIELQRKNQVICRTGIKKKVIFPSVPVIVLSFQTSQQCSIIISPVLLRSTIKCFLFCCSCCCWVASVVSDSVWPHRRQPTRLPLPWESTVKTLPFNAGGRFDPCSGNYQRRQWHPTPVLFPGKSHGWRSLVGCSPRGH